MSREFGSVILVPPRQRKTLVKQPEDVFIQCQDDDTWERPALDEDKMMSDFLDDKYHGAPKRFWNPKLGTRVGYNREGVFICERHHKRYFGIDREKASVLLAAVKPEAVPIVNAKGEPVHASGNDNTSRIMTHMLHKLPTLTDDMRYNVLHAAFQAADRNGNGKLSKPELGTVLRRTCHSLKAAHVEEIVQAADQDDDGQIGYKEFVVWLQRSADSRVGKALERSLGTEADIVRATFRGWDKHGAGLIPDRTLERALAKVHPELDQKQLKVLVECMDKDSDGNVDYDEFVDFLFHRYKGGQA